jgi:hypothetical protein
MSQQLSVLTGCSAGATVSHKTRLRKLLWGLNCDHQESFVVVPFELVKIRSILASFASWTPLTPYLL